MVHIFLYLYKQTNQINQLKIENESLFYEVICKSDRCRFEIENAIIRHLTGTNQTKNEGKQHQI